MLIERLSDPYFKLLVFKDKLSLEELLGLARCAFLYIIASRDASKVNKLAILSRIVGVSPSVCESISDEEMVSGLRYLSERLRSRHLLLSTAELDWVRHYVVSSEWQENAEAVIYTSMLYGSSHWDRVRCAYQWNLSTERKADLIRETLACPYLGVKRKLELAQEFGEPSEGFRRVYLRKLLCEGHYRKVRELGPCAEDDVLDSAVALLNMGRITQARELVENCLPERVDLMEEIEHVKSVLV